VTYAMDLGVKWLFHRFDLQSYFLGYWKSSKMRKRETDVLRALPVRMRREAQKLVFGHFKLLEFHVWGDKSVVGQYMNCSSL
jgi:hypothetical protein